jgi:hypothetical protein
MGKLRAKMVIASDMAAIVLNDETGNRIRVEPMEAAEGNFQQVRSVERGADGCDLFH